MNQPGSGYVSFGFAHHSDSESDEEEDVQEQEEQPQEQPEQQDAPPPQQEAQEQGPLPQQEAQHQIQEVLGPAADEPAIPAPQQQAPQSGYESESDSDEEEPQMDERAMLRIAFPNLPEDVEIVHAEGFNCHGHSVGLDYSIIGADGARSVQQMRNGMAGAGKEVVEVREADFDAANVVWYGPGADQVLHSARKVGGGNWSSKLGAGPIVQHTIAQLNGGMYGNALYYAHIRDAE